MTGLFITGTDTGVGKTRVTCWLARRLTEGGIDVGVCKPAVTGAEQTNGATVWPDLEALHAVCPTQARDKICPFRWNLPLAPPAAQLLDPDSPSPSLADFKSALDHWIGTCQVLLCEGIGGLLCPLTEDATVADLAVAWGRPVLIVARLGLGTLNHTLLTLDVAQRRGLNVAAILLNQPNPGEHGFAERTNKLLLERRVGVPVLGPVEHQPHDDLPAAILSVDWPTLMQTRSDGF